MRELLQCECGWLGSKIAMNNHGIAYACPNCGAGAHYGHECNNSNGWYVSCDDCYTCVGEAYDASFMPMHCFTCEEDAADAWNRRAR